MNDDHRSGAEAPESRLARAALALPAGALALIAGLSFDGAFDLAGIWRMCLACSAIPAAIAAAGPARRSRPLPLALTVAVSAAVWLAVLPALAAAFAAPSAPLARAGWADVLSAALTDAPMQLLTTAPPVVADATLLAGLGTLVWWAAAWAAEAAVRARPDGRGSLLAALPPGLVLLAGTAAGVPRGSASRAWPAASFLAVLVLLLAAQRTIGRPRPPGRGRGQALAGAVRVLLALGTATITAGTALVIAPLLPGMASRPPADPRELIKPPSRVESLLDPLSLVTEWLSARPRLLFTIRTADPVNLRWLVLDRYDGQHWTSSADYIPAGTALPAEAGITVASRTVSEDVRVTGLPGTWLPAPNRPARIVGTAVRVDPVSGMLATLDGARASGLAYHVTSAVPTPGLRQLENAVPGSGPDLAGQRVLPPGLPPAVASYGAGATAGVASPYQEMLLLQDRLLRDFHYDPRAAPGGSYGHLWFFVSRHRVGGPEVFATLFAVLARRAGFASRVAIGFLPGQPVAPGQYAVTTADVLIWPEVYFRGLGWVPFFPLPKPGSGKNGEAIRPLGQPASRHLIDQQIARSQRSPILRPRPGQSRAGRGPGAGVPAGVLALALLGVLVVAGAGYLAATGIGRALVRRGWRRGPDPRHQVAGAWQDALSRLTAAGGRPVSSLTPEEVVEHAVEVAGPAARAPAELLAGLANAALFGQAQPTAEDAAAASRAAAEVTHLARRRTSVRSRGASLMRPIPPGYNRPRRNDRPSRHVNSARKPGART